MIVTLGVLGNTLAGMVMLRPRFRKLSASVYLLILAGADTGCLLLNNKIQYWMMKDTGVSLYTVPWLCRIYLWLSLSVPFVSSWLVVLVTLERVFIVCRPLHAKVWCTRKTAWRASLGLVLVMFLGNTYVFGLSRPGSCRLDPASVRIVTVGAIVMFSCLPFLIIFVSNVGITVQLLRQHNFIVKKLSANNQAQADTQKLTTMLIANSCVFIILTLPYNSLLSYKQLGGRPDRWALLISEYFLCLNHACNFILYTLTGSLYREELAALFCRNRHGVERGIFRGTDRRNEPVTETMNINHSVETTTM